MKECECGVFAMRKDQAGPGRAFTGDQERTRGGPTVPAGRRAALEDCAITMVASHRIARVQGGAGLVENGRWTVEERLPFLLYVS